MSDYLPEEVVAEILAWLPVKSLMRCRLVCKSWKSLLETSAFIDSHFTHQDYNLLLVKIPTNEETGFHDPCLLHVPETGESKSLNLPPPLLSRRRPITVHGCEGLMIMYDDLDDPLSVIIWNPSIRKFVNLPAPLVVNYDYENVVPSYHIGYDAVTNDYKVLRVLITESQNHAPWDVMVYSLANTSWKTLSADVVPTGYTASCGRGILLNNALHWLCERANGRNHCIMVIDMHNEIYTEMAVP